MSLCRLLINFSLWCMFFPVWKEPDFSQWRECFPVWVFITMRLLLLLLRVQVAEKSTYFFLFQILMVKFHFAMQ